MIDLTVRHDLYARGFVELGHDVCAIASRPSAEGFPYPVRIFDDASVLCDSHYWQDIRADIVVMVTWHGMLPELHAIRASGSRAVAISDTDGFVSPRFSAREVLRRMIAMQTSPIMKLRTAKFWLQRVLLLARQEEQAIVESTTNSDAVLFCSAGAAANFNRFLLARGEAELVVRTTVIPYPIDVPFLEPISSEARENRVVSIGRWDDPQKNAELLASAIRLHLRQRPDTEFIIIGRNGDRYFRGLTKKHKSVRYLGIQSPAQIAEHLRGSRSLLISSRWETGPVVAYEALACGCTVVSSPITNMIGLCEDRQFGRIARSHGAHALSKAISDELIEWDHGMRSPEKIAARWQPEFQPMSICKSIIASIDSETKTSPKLLERGAYDEHSQRTL
jgi:glycosyltransferase involved in cell wall biosynthesis